MISPIIVKHEKTIDKTTEALWQLIEPAENISKWFAMTDKSELISGKGKGRLQRVFSKWGSKEAQIEQEVVEYEPMKMIRWKHIKELINGKPAPAISRETYFTIELSPAGKNTTVTLKSENYPGSFFKGLLIRMIAKARISAAMNKSLEILSS